MRTLRADLRKARDKIERLERDTQAGRVALATLAADAHRFTDPTEQLRFEVELAWARRTTPQEKPDLPLGPWTVGPEFIPTLEAVEGIERAKVIDVNVEILTGRARQSAGRQVHPLRTNATGNAPSITRADGATCWRASLQTGTAGARRLHWWALPDGTIELSEVRLHDDMRP